VRTVNYTKLLPDICTGGYNPPATQNVMCAPCPPNTISQNGACAYCPAGQLYKNGACVANNKGNIVHKTLVYFGDDSTSSWPDGFTTGCSGVCGSKKDGDF